MELGDLGPFDRLELGAKCTIMKRFGPPTWSLVRTRVQAPRNSVRDTHQRGGKASIAGCRTEYLLNAGGNKVGDVMVQR
jgi:hypothetical protein